MVTLNSPPFSTSLYTYSGALSAIYVMRYLLTLAQDDECLASIASYCLQRGLDLRCETWHLDQRDFEFHLLYAKDSDSAYVNWLLIQYPRVFFKF